MDILKFAIDMELEGEKYYRKQAANNAGSGLHTVFISLAEDESQHARILKDKLNGLPCRLYTSAKPSAQNVFDGIGDFKIDIKSNPEQLDVYRIALEKEKQSIDLYKNLLLKSPDDKDLYEYLISQEEEHYRVMEEIVKIVSRPKEWVESAEFGIREEY